MHEQTNSCLSAPEKVQIEPTNRCNCRCKICRRSYWSRPLGDLSLAKYICVLDQLGGSPKIHLQGQGEPLLNSDLVEMISETRKRGMRIHFNTNATLLTAEKGRQVLDGGVNRINCSLDTLNPEIFNQTRPGPPLEVVIGNLDALSQTKAKKGYLNTSLAIAAVAKESTIADLPAVVRFAADAGFDLVYVQNVNFNFGEYGKTIADRPKEKSLLRFNRFFNLAQEVAVSREIELFLPDLNHCVDRITCGWPFKACNITWDGYVTLCCLQPDPEVMSFGNVFKAEFQDIWSSKIYEDFRSGYLQGGADVCDSCPALRGRMWNREIALTL